MTATIVSINVGLPREVEWKGRLVVTSFWKSPREGRVQVARLNLEGDRQSDLSVHGGSEKAVYAYPLEHYADWEQELPSLDFPLGAFGENLTTEGLLESDVHIGDRVQIGTAELMISQPRTPCYKLGIRFGRDDMVSRFHRSGRCGFYLSVLREGHIARGDRIELLTSSERTLSVADVAVLLSHDSANQELLRRAVSEPALPEPWREYFEKRLDKMNRAD